MSIFTFTELIISLVLVLYEIIKSLSFFLTNQRTNRPKKPTTYRNKELPHPPHPQIFFLINKGTLTYMYFFQKRLFIKRMGISIKYR